MLDALSLGIGLNLLSTQPGNWRYFISRIVLRYHKEKCKCRSS